MFKITYDPNISLDEIEKLFRQPQLVQETEFTDEMKEEQQSAKKNYRKKLLKNPFYF
jgi:hypothetical protein